MAVPVFSVLRWVIGAGDGVACGSFREADGSGEDWRVGGLADGIRKSERYVARLGCLATYGGSMLLV